MPSLTVEACTSVHKNPVSALIACHDRIVINPERATLIESVLHEGEAILTTSGALATWNPKNATGRIPKDTYIVRDAETEKAVDWHSSFCNPMTPELFDTLMEDALSVLSKHATLYLLDRSAGHDPDFALPIRILTDSPLTSLFADTMLCPQGPEIAGSVFARTPFTLVVVPRDALDGKQQVIAMDCTRRMGIVYGTRYLGAVKKTIFTVMNYLLPQHGVLPLHCSANEGPDRTSALFLGLSGTGKTTLSNDPARTLIGDDEHGWNDEGVFNLEGGCYAKLIKLRKEKEPDLFRAVFGEKPIAENGCIIENAMTYPDGTVDVDDDRLTENSRAAYPLRFLSNTRSHAITGHPKSIIFLTADAHGVLPPVAVLDRNQALLWFLMGYTSKLAGTENGISKPVSAFSRFFGAPFMPALPSAYLDLFAKKIAMHGSSVTLINTGWTGGSYGIGKRFDIDLTRKLVNAALDGSLTSAPLRKDPRWKFTVPTKLPRIDPALLDPKATWADPDGYEAAADGLASEFAAAFEKSFGGSNIDVAVRRACPGMEI